MTDLRPDPDKLLQAVQTEDSDRGSLRIYLGYAPGVGKSYAMLKNAHELKKQGVDVVVGYLEAHGRPETEEMLSGLESVAAKEIPIAGTILREFDLELALKRKPQVLLVDELAHTNALGCRHTKRWQDIDELLQAGISVHTTLNVQHLASLSDIVGQITGVQVRETVPDSIFDAAAEVTLVDLTPDELLKRLKAGKIYKNAQAERALSNYFKKSNLVALREIALRRTAERVHADVAQARLTANIQTVYPAQDRLGCLIDSDEAAASAIRATARMAGSLHCHWVALCVTSARQLTRFPSQQANITRQTELAKELGGKIIERSGAFFISEVLRWAREEGITKLILSRPHAVNLEKWLERLLIFFFSSQISIIWVQPSVSSNAEPLRPPANSPSRTFLRPYIETTGIFLVCFLLAALISWAGAPEATLTLIYLLGVIIAAVIHGQGASAYAAVLSSFILSFGLTDFTWRASWTNAQYLVSFGLCLGIGLLASQMTSRLKNQAELARRERILAESLYNFTVILSSSVGLHQIVATAQEYLQRKFDRSVIIFLPAVTGNTQRYLPLLRGNSELETDTAELAVADWVGHHGQPAGSGTQTLPRAKALYLPLKSTEGTVGVLAVGCKKDQPRTDLVAYEKFTHPLAAKLESAQIVDNAEKIFWQAERERLRSDLLGSVSESLKMPLTVLALTSASLASPTKADISIAERNELLGVIREESLRLQRLVDNFTQLTRFQSGSLPLKLEKTELNEFVRTEIFKMERNAATHALTFHPSQTPLNIQLDPLLFSQVIHNLVDNAIEHTPRATPITISVRYGSPYAQIAVEDEGNGLPDELLEKIFEKYYRISADNRGAGLGLTVCRAIVDAHQGHLWAENRSPKGLRVVVELPIKDSSNS